MVNLFLFFLFFSIHSPIPRLKFFKRMGWVEGRGEGKREEKGANFLGIADPNYFKHLYNVTYNKIKIVVHPDTRNPLS